VAQSTKVFAADSAPPAWGVSATTIPDIPDMNRVLNEASNQVLTRVRPHVSACIEIHSAAEPPHVQSTALPHERPFIVARPFAESFDLMTPSFVLCRRVSCRCAMRSVLTSAVFETLDMPCQNDADLKRRNR
jgi:hypothetical protein